MKRNFCRVAGGMLLLGNAVRWHTPSPVPIVDRRQVTDFNLLPPEVAKKGFGAARGPAVTIPPCSDFYEVAMSRGSGPGGQGCNSSSNKVEMRVDVELFQLWLDAYLEDVIGISRNGTATDTPDEPCSSQSPISGDAGRSEFELWKTCRVRVHPNVWPPVIVVSEGDSSMSAIQQQQINGVFAATPAEHIVQNLLNQRGTSDGASIILASHQHRSAFQNEEECLLAFAHMAFDASRVSLEGVRSVGLDGGSTSQKINRATRAMLDRGKAKRRMKGNHLKMQQAVRAGKW